MSPLRSSRLRRILVAYTVNRLGTWFGLVALSLAVFDHTHSALAVAALLFAWQALPAFLVPAVVARVEASAHHSALAALYFFEAIITAALAVLLWHFWLPAGLLLVALLFAWESLPTVPGSSVVARVEASAHHSALAALYFFEAIITAALAVLLWHFWLPAVLLLVALDGTAALAASALLRAEVARAGRDQVAGQRDDAMRSHESLYAHRPA